MATAHVSVKTRSGRNRPRKRPGTPKSASPAKTAIKRRVSQPTQAPFARGPAAPERSGSQVAERGARIRVQGRLREMIEAELLNLEKAESVLRCLMIAMDSPDKGSAYFPDVVEVAGDLVQRSTVDLDDLYHGRIPDLLMASLRVER